MAKEKYIKICPNCGSTNIGIPPAGMDLRMTFPNYCRSCNNRGVFPEVNIIEIEKFRKKLRK